MTPAVGFWGTPTASVDFCEVNYAHSTYVCELFNTLSSAAMVAVGLLGIAFHRGVLERRFLLAFAALAVVGVGSAAFHATLRFELQMLDELPMLYLALVMVFILIELGAQRRFGNWFPWALTAHGVLVTALCAGTRGKLQFFAFQLSFGSLEMFCLYRAFVVFKATQNGVARRLFLWGMSAYWLAITVWFVDLRFCDWLTLTLSGFGLPNPELHAFWHIFVSLGFYALILFIAYERLTRLGKAPALRWQMGCWPRLTVIR